MKIEVILEPGEVVDDWTLVRKSLEVSGLMMDQEITEVTHRRES